MNDRLSQYIDPSKWVDINTDTSTLSDSEKELLKRTLNKDWSTPRFKMRWFQGQAQITKWAIFRQWMLELRNIEEAIEKIDYQLEKGLAEIEVHRYHADNSPNPGERQLAKVEIKQLERQIARSTRMKKDTLLDRHYYLDLLNEFLASDDGKIPDGSGRTWMEIINSDEQDQYEKQIWTNRLGKQAALDILFYGRIGVGNMDAILQMSPDQQAETLVLATDHAVHLQAYQKQLQLDSANKAQQGIELDKQELLFPEPPKQWIDKHLGNSAAPKNIPNQPTNNEQLGGDLDVYNV